MPGERSSTSNVIHTVVRVADGPGGRLRGTVKTFWTEEAAQECVRGSSETMARLLDCQLVHVDGGHGQATGMTLRQFLNAIGIANVGHGYETSQVSHGDLLEMPRGGIILPG